MNEIDEIPKGHLQHFDHLEGSHITGTVTYRS